MMVGIMTRMAHTILLMMIYPLQHGEVRLYFSLS